MSPHPFEADVVRARGFELIDAHGAIRARLGVNPRIGDEPADDVVALEFVGGAGVCLLAGPNMAQLTLEVGGNQIVIVEAASDDGRVGGAAITLCDRDGIPVVCCRVDPDGGLRLDVACEQP